MPPISWLTGYGYPIHHKRTARRLDGKGRPEARVRASRTMAAAAVEEEEDD